MRKFVFIAFMSLILFIAFIFCGFSEEEWTYREDHVLRDSILSEDGTEYVLWGSDLHIDGLKKAKKLGKLLPKYSEDIAAVYSIKGTDDDRYVIVVDYDGNEFERKYRPKGMDSRPAYYIYAKNGESFYDIKDTNISAISYLPYSKHNENTDYYSYVFENGVVGDEAKSLLYDIYSREFDFYTITGDYTPLGSLSYFPDGVDWFCFNASLMYAEDYGYIATIIGSEGYEDYLLSENVVERLGINVNNK